MDRINPTPDQIVLKKFEAPKETPGGLVLPDNVTAVENSDKIGAVTEIGVNIELVKVGDKVVFSHNYATAVDFGGKETRRIFVNEGNILAILT